MAGNREGRVGRQILRIDGILGDIIAHVLGAIEEIDFAKAPVDGGVGAGGAQTGPVEGNRLRPLVACAADKIVTQVVDARHARNDGLLFKEIDFATGPGQRRFNLCHCVTILFAMLGIQRFRRLRLASQREWTHAARRRLNRYGNST